MWTWVHQILYFGACLLLPSPTNFAISEYQLLWYPLVIIYHRHGRNQKMPKIDTLDALEEHEEHEDDYQSIPIDKPNEETEETRKKL